MSPCFSEELIMETKSPILSNLKFAFTKLIFFSFIEKFNSPFLRTLLFIFLSFILSNPFKFPK